MVLRTQQKSRAKALSARCQTRCTYAGNRETRSDYREVFSELLDFAAWHFERVSVGLTKFRRAVSADGLPRRAVSQDTDRAQNYVPKLLRRNGGKVIVFNQLNDSDCSVAGSLAPSWLLLDDRQSLGARDAALGSLARGIRGRRFTGRVESRDHVTGAGWRVIVNVLSDVRPYLGNELFLAVSNPVDSKAILVLARILPG